MHAHRVCERLTQRQRAARRNDRGAAAKAKNGKMTGGHYAESVVGPAMGVPGAAAAPHAPQQMVHATSSSMVLPAARPPGQATNTLGHASPVGALELGFAGKPQIAGP